MNTEQYQGGPVVIQSRQTGVKIPCQERDKALATAQELLQEGDHVNVWFGVPGTNIISLSIVNAPQHREYQGFQNPERWSPAAPSEGHGQDDIPERVASNQPSRADAPGVSDFELHDTDDDGNYPGAA